MKNQNENIKTSHSRTFLSGIFNACRLSWTFRNNGNVEDPRVLRTAISGMTAFFNRTASFGFTLIELLVVVLIIGILSAIALPQYKKAVRKARVSEAKIILRALGDATEVYTLGNFYEPSGISDLDISIPESKNWSFEVHESGGSNEKGYGVTWRAVPKQSSEKYILYYADHVYGKSGYGDEDYGGKFICAPEEDAGIAQCRSLGNIESNFLDDAVEI